MPSSRRRSAKAVATGSLTVVFVLFLILLYQLLFAGPHPESSAPAPTYPESTPVSSGWYSLYFSDPQSPRAKSLRGGSDEPLVKAIRQARSSVDVAAYEFDLHSLRDALIEAYQRGIVVRMVTDSDNLQEAEIQDLVAAKIPVLGDRREGLMHNKFMIIDNQEVWTGSTNYTVNGVYHNDNNLLRIRSSHLADDYRKEFEEMFVEDQFGPNSPANTPYPSLTIDGTPLEVYFSPDDGTAAHLLALVNGARQSIHFLAYSFTSDDLAQAMLARAQEGVEVAGVFETTQVGSNQGTEYDRLRSAGLDVRLDGNPSNMHHKVLIIDGQTVVTGSYNFSRNAETQNDENTLVIHNKDIAAEYQIEFDRVFAEAKK